MKMTRRQVLILGGSATAGGGRPQIMARGNADQIRGDDVALEGPSMSSGRQCGAPSSVATWGKNPNNPIFQSSASGWDSERVQDPDVIRVGETYHMLYTGYGGGSVFAIGHAISTDLVNWTKDPNNPVLEVGAPGEFDANNVFESTTIQGADRFHMLYVAKPDSPTFNIGYAYSTDLVNWTKHPCNPVLTATKDWEIGGVSHPDLLLEGDTYHLFYTGKNASHNYQIGHATSTDLVNWTKDPNNPVVTISESGWDAGEARHSSVIQVDGTCHMLYGGADAANSPQTFQIGHATSTDLVNWTKDSENPIITTGTSGEFDDIWADTPELLQAGSTYYCLYRGYPGSGDGPREIGLASADTSVWG